jgi:hypothetical protein
MAHFAAWQPGHAQGLLLSNPRVRDPFLSNGALDSDGALIPPIELALCGKVAE